MRCLRFHSPGETGKTVGGQRRTEPAGVPGPGFQVQRKQGRRADRRLEETLLGAHFMESDMQAGSHQQNRHGIAFAVDGSGFVESRLLIFIGGNRLRPAYFPGPAAFRNRIPGNIELLDHENRLVGLAALFPRPRSVHRPGKSAPDEKSPRSFP
jgi:hypothetical protein